MSGVLRLANTGGSNGRSTIVAAASTDATFTLPPTGGTILTTDFDTVGDITWNGSNINITNADLNVNSGQLFIDESSGFVGIGTTSPGYLLSVKSTTSGGVDILDLDNLSPPNSYGGLRVSLGKIDRECRLTAAYGNSFFTFHNGVTSNEKLRIDADGRVLVGTDRTTSNNLLVVAGTTNGDPGFIHLQTKLTTPGATDQIGGFNFGTANSVSSARIIAYRDSGTWTAGASTPTALAFLVSPDGSATASEYARISENYGMTGGIVERFFRSEAKYFNGTTTVESPGFFLSRSQVPSISASGARIYFTFPTCWQHRKVIEARLIYGVNGNASGNPWTVNGSMYRAGNGQGYTTDQATFSFDLTSSAFNGKIYTTAIPTFPTLQREHINSLELEFTENVNGSTVGVFGLQLIESTRAV